MHQESRHLIIGTAGHVDHGKTALVGTLTGMETDRLKEERERGLSIELGFAYFDLPDHSRAGIVDVPGHEKFIRSMLSGAYGMDIVLFVVDAKEGVQEQTLEHLAILDLLGISNGILVMTKSDLATADELAEATEMTQEMLVGTSLEGIPTVSVSALTGAGIETLKQTIVEQVALATKSEEHDGIPRLYVDRVFTLQGFGVVVTGTLIGGSINREQRMVILPQGDVVRVRGIQVHNEPATVAQAGQRTALNLSGTSAQDIQRGDVLCPIEYSQVTDNIDVSLQVLSSFPRLIEHWSRFRAYLGTREIFCRLILLVDEAILPGDNVQVQLRLERPILTFRGDRIILRDFSAQHTVGGGEVINPFAPKHKRFTPETIATLAEWEEADDSEIVNTVLINSETLCVPESFLYYYLPHSKTDVKTLLNSLETEEKIVRWDKSGRTPFVSDAARASASKEKIVDALAAFHEAQPLLAGQNASQLRRELNIDKLGFEKLENQLITERLLVTEGNLLRLASHEIQFSQEEETAKATLEKLFLEAGMNTPALSELNTLLPEYTPKVLESTFFALLNLGQFIKIADNFFIHKTVFENVSELLTAHLRENETITVAEFREAAQTSRKYAVPFLEYCDSQNLTVRDDNIRRLHPRLSRT
ncbi:selenocysteine-specific translation elongation factor [Candidatus Poribacteria bacterium]|nr:selenocysteine-specific translation elongation factor [Candidatus Poribacteria bacterium]MYH80426.1 selenocysteine-specific translation elongation factor [Candidatus Poribacteria bacterium]MYK92858.1 selenocysteine-specific translation elongation factor [Candidatus Poribacteria bacterium]